MRQHEYVSCNLATIWYTCPRVNRFSTDYFRGPWANHPVACGGVSNWNPIKPYLGGPRFNGEVANSTCYLPTLRL